MYDPKSSNRISSPAKILWFEFLLNPSLLEKHLSQENPDPSACELIIQFLANSGASHSTEGNNCTGGSNQHGNSSQSSNVEEIILDGSQSPKEVEESKKCQALKLLALKVASVIKWDLNILEKKLPLTMQQTLITELLKVTGNKVDGLKISASGTKELAPVSHFAHIVFYSWILRAVIDASYPTKGQKGLNVQIPGQADPSAVPASALEAISRKLQDETEQSTNALEEILENGGEVQMPMMNCFGSVTEESSVPVHKWDQSLVLKKDDYVCQVSFDLGQFYFFQEKYEKASKHFLKASNLHPKLRNPVCCNLNPAKLRGFYDACAHLLGFEQSDSSTPLKESLQTSVKHGHPNTVDILKSDNLKQEIPLAIRDMVEINLLRENAGKKLQIPVAFLNAVRRSVDGQIVLTDCSSMIKANGEKSFLMLCDFVKEVALNASPRQKAFLKNFLRMICLSCGPVKTPFKNIEAVNILFTKEEIDELLSQGSHGPRLSALKLDKTFTSDPSIQIGVLERRLLSCREAPATKFLITQLRGKGQVQSLWTINSKWELPRAASIFLKSVPSHIDQETLHILMAKTSELRAIKKYGEARQLYRMIEKETRNSVPRLIRFLTWEVLRIDLLEVLDAPVYICQPSHHRGEIVTGVLSCFKALNQEREIPPDCDLLELCAAVLLNFREWDKLMDLDTRQQPYFELARTIAGACKDVFMNKGTRGASRELWELILPVFSVSASSQIKRSCSGIIKDIPRETSQSIMNRFSFLQFVKKLKDTLALGVMISCLAKFYNILRDDSMGEIFFEYQMLWPAVVSNCNVFNQTNVGEAFQGTLQHALSIHPTHSSWLRTKGDVMYVQGHYSTALKFYLSAAMVSTDYFYQPLPRVLFDDLQYKHMIHCCTKLQNHTQSAVLHQFLDDANYSVAFKALGEKVCNDSCDVYYDCIWDVTLLEFLINLHARKGELDRKQFVMQLVGQLELNSNNNDEIQREAASIRKGRFLRAMAKQYL